MNWLSRFFKPNFDYPQAMIDGWRVCVFEVYRDGTGLYGAEVRMGNRWHFINKDTLEVQYETSIAGYNRKDAIELARKFYHKNKTRIATTNENY